MSSLSRAQSWPLLSGAAAAEDIRPVTPKTTQVQARRFLCRHYYPEGGWGWIISVCAMFVHILNHGVQLSCSQLVTPASKKYHIEPVHPAAQDKMVSVLALLIIGTLTCASLLLLALYLYFKISFTYWDKRGVFVPFKPIFPFGNAKDVLLQRKGLSEVLSEACYSSHANAKRFCGFYFLSRPHLVIGDVELVQSIMKTDFEHFTDRLFHGDSSDPLSEHLVSMKGKQWKVARLQLSPAFTKIKMKMMFPTVCKYTDQLLDVLHSGETDEVDIHELLDRATIDMFGCWALGLECASLKDPNTKIAHYIRLFFNCSSFLDLFIRLISVTWPSLLTKIKFRSVQKPVADFFLNTITETLRYRKANNVVRNDFLQLLLQIKDNQEFGNSNNFQGAALTETGIVAQSLIFFVGGYETTSLTMAYCLYELAVNPGIQEKARGEIKKIVEQQGFTYDSVMGMSYLKKCVLESLRKHSPVPSHNRECTKDYTIPGTEIVIEKGTVVFIVNRAINNDPLYYPNPEVFNPERFSEDEVTKRPPAAYTPFGFGPRRCIGSNFATVETQTCLAKLLLNYKFSVNAKTKFSMVYDPRIL
ncbi:cytochrome P450 6a8-like isoform X3 [Photinus pyralis]|uniref:cytochrome P450 6a8-like isoform X3 n=1 Tax=Photinus pyralis TaxID=7054 RepID=UPI001266FCA9|nr:cytochrome P450 6a8-like isoform X3 [Photinus pyralis]